uniref:Uncharacterized protein n=1 Tax=Tanacetum cinerariifolium TaxID=118510 RepID=A0A6L2MA96_TANCI|nr:hypothetical protein [Tanacetum cinerariifolium]
MDSLSPQVVSAAKLPILNPNEFDLWKISIEQYFLMTDYSLWEVILNGDSPAPTRVVDGVLQPVAPTTAEHRPARKNELKAHGTLLMALPDKHQLKFNSHKDAKTLMEAIEKSTTEPVSAAASVSAVCAKMHVSSLPNVDSLSNAIDADDLEEIDLKWQMAMLTMRAKRFLQRTRRNLGANGPTYLGFDMSKVECYNCHKKGHFTRKCRSIKDTRRNDAAEPQRRNVPVEASTSNALVSQCDGVGSYVWSFQAEEEPANYTLMAFSSSSSFSDNEVVSCSKACSKAYAQLESHYDNLTADFCKSQVDVISYQTGLESVEARLLVYKQNESVFEEDIKLLKLEVQLRDNALVSLRQTLEKAKQERDALKLKLGKFQTSSKNLTELLASQTNAKIGLGYNSQVFTRAMFDCDDYLSSKSDESCPLVLFMIGSNPVMGIMLSSIPIIEDWVSDFKDEPETKTPQTVSSFVHSTEQVKSPRHSVQHVETSIPPQTAILKPTSNGKCRNRIACFVCKSLDNLIKDYDYHEKKMSKPVSIYAVRPVSIAVPKTSVTRPKQVKPIITKTNSPPKRHTNRSPSPKVSNSPPRVTTVKAPMGNPQHALKDKGLIDSGCSRHMTRNMSYLSDFEEINGGYVAFGGNPKGGKISGKGKIKTRKLDFDDVYFVKELKFNLFSVSQMYDKKNNVLFTNTEYLVLSPEFKLPDESQVLLRVPRENNMYNVKLKNIVPSGDLTCLFAKATIDESNLWHRRLGHVNFKTKNKLVKGNLVRGLPTKVFENDNTCVTCKKGKQHRASCKNKPVRSVDQPLYRLHMDLFGPIFVKIPNKNSYCLVVTDDYSRFTWVFFLATKDVTSPILKTFITGLENQLSLKVKVIRSDNGTKFKNNDLNQFCGMKGIKREFSVPRTPQQNGIAERKNRTLIKAARTMLADSLLPIRFWAEAVNTACYVQNRVLVTKPYNKTPYELYMVEHQVFKTNFDAEKAGEESDQQYVLFPVWSFGFTNPQNTNRDAAFNEKELEFDEKKPESEVNVSPSRYRDLSVEFEDLFDNIINEVNAAGTLVPTVGQISPNNTNTFSAAGPSNATASPTHGKSSCIDASQLPDDSDMPELEDITYSDDEDDVGAEADFNNLETTITVSLIPTTRVHKDHHVTQIISDLSSATQTRKEPKRVHQDLKDPSWIEAMQEELLQFKMQKRVHQALKDPSWIEAMQEELLQFKMQKVWVLVDLPHGKRAIGTKWVFKNKKSKRGIVVRNKARLVTQVHTQEEGIDYEEVFAPVERIEAIRLFLAYASFMGFMVYQMDIKSAFLYGTIEEEVYVYQPLRFEDPDHPDKVYKVIYVDDIIFGATNKDLCKSFEKLMKDKFQTSLIKELTFLLGLQVKQKRDGIFINHDKYVAEILRKFGFSDGKLASTPIDTEKTLLKDPDSEDVDVHTYRSMIGSLMYLTSSRPDIMFSTNNAGCSIWNGVFEKDVTSYKYLKCWLPHHTINGSQFTMSNPHQELASPDQTVSGKDSSNPLMADNLPKIIWYSTHHVTLMKS